MKKKFKYIFAGIRYSDKTNIFYKLDNNQVLHKFCVYGNGIQEWRYAEFTDSNHRFKRFKKVNQKQLDKYPDLEKPIKKGVYDGIFGK